MGREKGTHEHVNFAMDYLRGKLNHPIFKISKQNHRFNDKEFPFMFTEDKRLTERKTLWGKILKLGKNTLITCQSAIGCFSKLLIAQYALNKLLPKLIAQNNKLRKKLLHKEALYYEALMYTEDDKTISALDDEIRETRELLKSYARPAMINQLYAILEMNDRITELFKDYRIADFNVLYEMSNGKLCDFIVDKVQREMLLKYKNFYLLPPIGRPQNMIFNAMILTVLLELLRTRKVKRKVAEQITSDLINEYCYYNFFFAGIVKKQSQKKVSDLYDNSYFSGEPLFKARPLRNIANTASKKSD